jgi:hypothetical protein
MSRNRCDGCVLYFKLRARKPWHILAPICRVSTTKNVLWRAATEKENLTTKGTKSTKFIIKNIRTLRGLRALRGEKVLRRMVRP